MPVSNSSARYGTVAKTFHWLTALLIFTTLPIGILANDLAHEIRMPGAITNESRVARAAFLFSLHKSLGVTTFFVALLRIAWAFSQPKPGLLNGNKRLEAILAETVHWLLYGSLVLVPLSGWVHHASTVGFAPIWWPFGQGLPFVPKSESLAQLSANLHFILVWVLGISVLLHVAGALKHHVIDRDATLRRMLPGTPDLPKLPDATHPRSPVLIAIAVWAAALMAGASLGMFQQSATSTEAAALESVQSQWSVQEGTLSFKVQQMGQEVTGTFSDWTAAIWFDETATQEPIGSVDVTVSIASLALGSVTEQALGADFFNAANFPNAEFSADIFRDGDGYSANGFLVIRDKTLPVALPFALDLQQDQATMTGTLPLDRRDFNIGNTLPDESSVGFGVNVEIKLTATR